MRSPREPLTAETEIDGEVPARDSDAGIGIAVPMGGAGIDAILGTADAPSGWTSTDPPPGRTTG